MALFVTLLIEIPVLLMIAGGSSRLCSLIGRSRYQLLMAFLPLSSAISGNCGKAIIVSHDNSFDVFVICNILILPNLTTSSYIGLQASTLATRAISHLHVTKQNYLSWLWIEIQVAGLLGLGMGIIVGGIAYQASGFDFAFGFTIFFANVISVLTAGLTGTIAPLLFTFIFCHAHRTMIWIGRRKQAMFQVFRLCCRIGPNARACIFRFHSQLRFW